MTDRAMLISLTRDEFGNWFLIVRNPSTGSQAQVWVTEYKAKALQSMGVPHNERP